MTLTCQYRLTDSPNGARTEREPENLHTKLAHPARSRNNSLCPEYLHTLSSVSDNEFW